MPKHTDYFQIAIDGPVASGKGTASRLAAERLGFLYVDTGAMYRVTALLAERNDIDLNAPEAEKKIVPILARTEIEMHNPTDEERDGRLTTVKVDGEDVSWKIRTEEMSNGSSLAARLPEVRKILVEKQQKIAAQQNVVMEGRDITYRVLPDADLKIYLTASEVVRAKRRHLQLQTRGEDISFEKVLADLKQRDKQDMGRAADPLKIVDDALVVDSSDFSIGKVVDAIVSRAELLLG